MNNNFFSRGDIEKLGNPIWDRLFMISMAYKDTLSAEHVRMFGMPTVGDKSIDSDMHNQVVDRYITINEMVEYFKSGIHVYVKIHKETKDIYDIISAYLLCWKQYLDNGINIGGAPLDDLVALDRFATSVYDHAVEHISDDYINSNIIKYIGDRKIGRAAFDKKPEPVAATGEVKKRESLASTFSERVFSTRGGLWK